MRRHGWNSQKELQDERNKSQAFFWLVKQTERDHTDSCWRRNGQRRKRGNGKRKKRGNGRRRKGTDFPYLHETRQDTFGVFMPWIQPWGHNSQSMLLNLLLETVPLGGSDKITWHHWRPSFVHIFIHAKNSCLCCPRKTPRSSFMPFKSSLAKLLLKSSLLAPSNGRCHSCSR